MSWQDVTISVGQFVFAVGLLPSIFGRFKPALVTSLTTAAGLTVFGFCFWTLGLYLSMAGVLTGAAGWWVLTYQALIALRPTVAPDAGGEEA